MKNQKIVSMAALLIASMGVAQAQIKITEVDPAGSGDASYAADWFEVWNSGPTAVDVTGWKMDDNSDSFGSAVPIRGITSIAPGQIVIFLEGTTTGSTDSTIDANFATAWFGANVPAGLTLANYGGSGVGLSTSGDAVNLFDSTGIAQAGVTFVAAPAGGATFDNAAGLSGAISQASVVGVNGAFVSANGLETGSPGTITSAPEPSTMALAGFMGLATLVGVRRFANRQS